MALIKRFFICNAFQPIPFIYSFNLNIECTATGKNDDFDIKTATISWRFDEQRGPVYLKQKIKRCSKLETNRVNETIEKTYRVCVGLSWEI